MWNALGQPDEVAARLTINAGSINASVIIAACAMDRLEALASATKSALRQRPAPREVIVVIDHNDLLLHRARQRLPDAQVIANAQARGLSGARNTGVLAAGGEIVAFLDDDAQAQPGWLAQLVAPYTVDRVVGTGGEVEPEWLMGGAPRWLPEEFYWVVGCSYRGLTGGELRNPIGANMSFRRDAVLRAGGFTNGLGRIGDVPLGCEETELALRLTAVSSGRVIMHAPGALVAHLVPAKRVTWRYFWSRCWAEGLSKAAVTRIAGSTRGLASERRYVYRTLPAAVVRHGARALAGDVGGALRAGGICAGLLITAAGYVRGRIWATRSGMETRDGG